MRVTSEPPTEASFAWGYAAQMRRASHMSLFRTDAQRCLLCFGDPEEVLSSWPLGEALAAHAREVVCAHKDAWRVDG